MFLTTISEIISEHNPIYSLHPLFKKAFDGIFKILKDLPNKDPSAGVMQLGDGVRLIIDEYYPKPLRVSAFENHHKFIDIQLLITGEEWLFWAPLGGIDTDSLRKTPYDPEKDIEFFRADPLSPLEHSTRVVLKGNDVVVKIDTIPLVILWPGDLHMPCVFPNISQDEEVEYGRIKKIVAKIPA